VQKKNHFGKIINLNMHVDFRIKEILSGNIAITGIGNRLRGDDAFGPVMVDTLKEKTPYAVFDCGTSPENYLFPIIKTKPDTIIIFDAAEMDMPPGSMSVLKNEDILKIGFSTHDASPAMFMEFLKKETNANIFMIAVQPKTTQFGEGLSPEVTSAINELKNTFLKASD